MEGLAEVSSCVGKLRPQTHSQTTPCSMVGAIHGILQEMDVYVFTKPRSTFHRNSSWVFNPQKTTVQFDKDPPEFSKFISQGLVPIEPCSTQHTWILSLRVVSQDISEPPIHINPINSLIATFPSWEQVLLKEVKFIQPEAQVWELQQRGQCYAASNGSTPSNRGAFGWILSGSKEDRLLRCRGPVFGHAISSYRAEAFGMLSFLRFLL